MNLKSLQDKIDETPIIPMPAHYQMLDEASVWDWFRRFFGSPANTPRRPRDAPGRTVRYGPDGGALPIPDIFTRRRNLPWEQPGAPWDSPSGPSWRAPAGYRNPHTGGPGQYHPNDRGWFWVPDPDVEGGWHWELHPDPSKVPAEAFPQPTTPAGNPGHQLPGHGPNGLPIGRDGGEMPVNPDTGRPWTENPFTGEDYPVPPPWETPPPPPTMRPEGSPYGSTEVPVDGGLKPGHKPDNPFGGNEGPRSGPPQPGPGRLAYGGRPGGAARPTRTLQGLRTMGARK